MNNCYPSMHDLPPAPREKTGWPWTNEGAPYSASQPMGNNWPKVSIVTPSYNQGDFIEETIRSVLLQGYPNLEYIIIDGGSSDNSVEIIERYSQWLTYWVSEADNGQANAINKGFKRANGEILGWLNSDDTFLPHTLANMAAYTKVYPDAVMWIGACNLSNTVGNVLEVVEPRNITPQGIANWWYEGFFYQPAAFFSATAFEEVGPLDESLYFAMDLDLWLKMIKAGRFVTTNEIWAVAKRHPEAKTVKENEWLHAETITVVYNAGFRKAATNRLTRLNEYAVYQDKFRTRLRKGLRQVLVPL